MKPSTKEAAGPPITLRYRPQGTRQRMDANGFTDFLTQTLRTLQQVAEGVADHKVAVNYAVTDLGKNGRFVVQVTPIAKMADFQAIRTAQAHHVRNIAILEEGQLPADLDFVELKSYRKLGAIMEKHRFSTDVTVDNATAQATEELKHRLDLELQKDQWSHGSIRGHIRFYHSAGSKRIIRLYPRAGSPVVCQFRREDQEKVRGLIDEFVQADGNLRFRPNAYQPYFMKIEDINGIDVDGAPTFREMDGAAPEWSDDADPIDLIREGRSGWEG